jgi:hypothetical protein
VVVWESDGSSWADTSDSSVQGQRYASDGTALGSEFQVNTYTTLYQNRSSVAAEPDGDFVVVWESDGSSGTDTSASSIQGQRYTTASKVPSLSPAGLAGVVLLMSLVVGIALRRRA